MSSISNLKFCERCKALLASVIQNNELVFKCNNCASLYKSSDEDTLRYEEIKDVNLAMYDKILKKIVDDETNPKAYRDCPKCKRKVVVRQVEIGSNMTLINACTDCKHQWIDSKQQ
jgi:DNA-directed RNA polymerase subunit M/transcription elongation factor TFIIS